MRIFYVRELLFVVLLDLFCLNPYSCTKWIQYIRMMLLEKLKKSEYKDFSVVRNYLNGCNKFHYDDEE